MNEKKIIDLGCGIKKIPGEFGVDLNNSINPDVVHNLNKFPCPFEDDYSDTIVLDNTLEHSNGRQFCQIVITKYLCQIKVFLKKNLKKLILS